MDLKRNSLRVSARWLHPISSTLPVTFWSWTGMQNRQIWEVIFHVLSGPSNPMLRSISDWFIDSRWILSIQSFPRERIPGWKNTVPPIWRPEKKSSKFQDSWVVVRRFSLKLFLFDFSNSIWVWFYSNLKLGERSNFGVQPPVASQNLPDCQIRRQISVFHRPNIEKYVFSITNFELTFLEA